MRFTRIFTCILGIACSLSPTKSFSQSTPGLIGIHPGDSLVANHVQPIKKNRAVKPFSFVTDIPGNLVRVVKAPFEKENLKPLVVIGGITTVLFFLDEPIIKTVGNVFRKVGIEQQENFHTLIEVSGHRVIKYPGNINSFFYQLGQPLPTFLLAGGFYIYGKITHNPRASRTASEITESFITTTITIQTLKRITGRQSPNRATQRGGKWHWFPSLSDYNNDVTNYIAYPSGHMGTMMSVVTVIAQNYPEKKWIKPVGYSLIGLTALCQLNNKTHWPSDFPLGLGIGYLSAKIAHLQHQKKERAKKGLSLY